MGFVTSSSDRRWPNNQIPYEINNTDFPNVYLRMDANGVSAPSGPGGGTVNCQYGGRSYERLVFRQQSGYIEIRSVQFPQAFLRMDGASMAGQRIGSGGGTVNAQFGARSYERFGITEHGVNYGSA